MSKGIGLLERISEAACLPLTRPLSVSGRGLMTELEPHGAILGESCSARSVGTPQRLLSVRNARRESLRPP